MAVHKKENEKKKKMAEKRVILKETNRPNHLEIP